MIVIGALEELDTEIEVVGTKTPIAIDRFYMAVRNTKEISWIENLEFLAPTKNLYEWTISKKRTFSFTKNEFENHYFKEYVKHIIKKDICFKKDENIFICCFCKNESMCHRILLGCYLQVLGYEVYSTQNDMKKYEQYRKRIENMITEQKH